MLTSHFGKVKEIEAAGLDPVAISVGIPKWFKGRRLKALAPSWTMLRLSIEKYDTKFDAILAKLDPAEIAAEVGPKGVMLCWEKPGERCHRRRVAEWLEDALGIVVGEFGERRDTLLNYHVTPLKSKR